MKHHNRQNIQAITMVCHVFYLEIRLVYDGDSYSLGINQ